MDTKYVVLSFKECACKTVFWLHYVYVKLCLSNKIRHLLWGTVRTHVSLTARRRVHWALPAQAGRWRTAGQPGRSSASQRLSSGWPSCPSPANTQLVTWVVCCPFHLCKYILYVLYIIYMYSSYIIVMLQGFKGLLFNIYYFCRALRFGIYYILYIYIFILQGFRVCFRVSSA